MTINYEKILRCYMAMVGEAEGVDFVPSANDPATGLSDVEFNELLRLASDGRRQAGATPPLSLHFNKVAAQGELTITRLDVLPKIVGEEVKAEKGFLIVGHSETGHHHVVDAGCATLTRVDPFTAFLNVRKATRLVHQREYDTHPAIELQPGVYQFRTGREFDPFEKVIRVSAD